jgi:osmotically-inducible protein OsmY
VRDALTDATEIDIAVGGTELTLSGTVRSMGESDAAERAAWSTPGVTHVHNRLQITP